MRTAAIATAAALVALVLAGCDPVAGPPPKTENSFGAAPEPRDAEALLSPAPPLWRIDPAMDLSRHILDGVPDDPQTGCPRRYGGCASTFCKTRSFGRIRIFHRPPRCPATTFESGQANA